MGRDASSNCCPGRGPLWMIGAGPPGLAVAPYFTSANQEGNQAVRVRKDGCVSVSPPEELLAAFEVDFRELHPLQGGQGTAWGSAALVFKPVDMSIEALQWQERILGGIEEDGFRVARPTRYR